MSNRSRAINEGLGRSVWVYILVSLVLLLIGFAGFVAQRSMARQPYNRFGASMAVSQRPVAGCDALILIADTDCETEGVGCVVAIDSGDGKVVHHFRGAREEVFGRQMGFIGDGVADESVIFILAEKVNRESAAVRLFSVRDGRLMREFRVSGDGLIVLPGEDFDEDGAHDLIVAFSERGREPSGVVTLLSTRDGTELKRSEGYWVTPRRRWQIALLGDCNGDGIADVAMVDFPPDPGGALPHRARLQVLSGDDFTVLWTRNESGPEFILGRSIAAAGDVDGDGWPDLIATEEYVGPRTAGMGNLIWVLSGKDGRIIHRVDEALPDPHGVRSWGTQVRGLGDVDGDGCAEFVVGSPDYALSGGAVEVYSGRYGTLLYRIVEPSRERGPVYKLGMRLSAVPDSNDDSSSDLLVAAVCPAICMSRGEVFLFSGSSGGLLRMWRKSDVAQCVH